MKPNLKPLNQQVIVITGASSGIGLTTARMAASAGARLVLAARSGDALAALEAELKQKGADVAHVVADVSKPEDIARIAQTARERFGRFDTWVNNAASGMYGRIEETPVEDMRKLFDVNFWSVVHGSLEALKELKSRGGALINIGSVESERAVVLQGAYAATKHAVKAFTDALRDELEAEGAPVSVTLIKPAAIDTPFPVHARTTLDTEPMHVAPVYAPEVVARAILHCAEHPTRDVFAGGGGKSLTAMDYHTPRLTDWFMRGVMLPRTRRSSKPARSRDESLLYRPAGKLETRGNYDGHVMNSSLYTQASLRPALTASLLAGSALALAALLRARRG